MPNFGPLLTASLGADPNAQRLALIERVESCLTLPLKQASEQLLSSAPVESEARKLNDMLVLVRVALCRELGITAGPGGEERFKTLADGYAANTLQPLERVAYEKLSTAFSLGSTLLQTYPALATPPVTPPDEAALRAKLDALYQRQLEAQKYTVPPLVTAERLEAMVALVADYRTLLNSVAPGRQVYTDISFFAAHATYALARGWQQLGRSDLAAGCYADAAPLFKRGERPKDARESMQLARQLGYSARADFDGASAGELRTLIDGQPDAFTRAGAYSRLSAWSTAANSLFDAAHYAEQSAEALVMCGYADPDGPNFDAAFQAWIGACSRADAVPAGCDPLDRINAVARLYLQIEGVRFASRSSQSLATAAGAQATIEKLSAAMLDTGREVELAHERVMTELARYRP
jgi:hypothetical protein